MPGKTAGSSGVDSHHHLWRPDPRRYPWLDRPQVAALNRPFGYADLARAAAGTGIGATVVVQAADDPAETADLLADAGGGPIAPGGLRVAGVVGWVDLANPGADDVLARLRSGPGGRLLAGVRANLREAADPGWLAGPVPAAALRSLAAVGLALDVLAGSAALNEVAAAAAAHAELRIILDHAGQPPLGDRTALDAWAVSIGRLARHPNVAVKFSGLLTRAPGTAWNPAALRPVVGTLLGAFGQDRVMFGSDWPVCLLAADYARVVVTAREALAGADTDRVFGGTARAWYRLPA
jgi:L-fuconolactonase